MGVPLAALNSLNDANALRTASPGMTNSDSLFADDLSSHGTKTIFGYSLKHRLTASLFCVALRTSF